MPPAIKRSISMTILIMMLGAFGVSVISWTGIELVKSHDNDIQLEHIAELVEEMHNDFKNNSLEHIQIMDTVNKNQIKSALMVAQMNLCKENIENNTDSIYKCQKFLRAVDLGDMK